MPRPQRIEYPHAFYHVMNRGRERQTIFHDERYFQAFLVTLGEAQRRFGCIIHAYCLMSNHYHLLIETPNANLGRIMRHINGVYTQRYNRLKQTDGPLFRGRYKAILVEKDAYLLQLSRYIHRNPIETQSPLVEDLAQYPWSSYPAYIGQAKAEPWLQREYTYAVLGHRYKFKQYQRFVQGGNDEELMTFYSKGNTASVLGCTSFKEWVQTQHFTEVTRAAVIQQLQPELDITAIIAAVAAFYDCPISQLTEVNKGPTKGFEGRKVAMYFCQELLAANLRDIAKHFQLGHGGSVSFITHQIRKRQKSDKVFAQLLGEIVTFIMKQAA